MSYYNPQEDSDQSNYYNPYNNIQDQKPDLMAAAGQMAKTLVIFGALNIAGVKATSMLSRAAGSALQKYGTGRLGQLASSVENPSIGSILKASNPGKAIIDKLKSTSIYKADSERRAYLSTVKQNSPERYGIERVKSAFQNPKTFAGAYARAWGKNVGYGMGVAYAVDSLTGVTSESMGLEKKSLWDIPGQITNFAKWTGSMSIYGPMFGAIGPIAGLAKSSATNALQRAFSGSFGKSVVNFMHDVQGPGIPIKSGYGNLSTDKNEFFDKTVLAGANSQHEKTFASNKITKGLALGRTVSESLRYTDRAFNSSMGSLKDTFSSRGSLGSRIKKVFNPILASIKSSKDILADNISDRSSKGGANTPGLEAIAFLSKLRNNIQSNPTFNGISLSKINSALEPAFKHNNKPSVIEKIFNLEPIRNKDVVNRDWISEVEGTLKSRYAHGDVDILLDHIKNMRVGRHIYKPAGSDIKGGGVDLSAFDPIYVAQRAMSSLFNAQIKVPLSKMTFTLGDITKITPYIAKAPSVAMFDRKPNFLYKNGSIGDLAKNNDALFFTMKGSKGGNIWAVFDGANVDAAETDRTLRFSTLHGIYKDNELKEINIRRMKARDGADWYNKNIAKYDKPLHRNKFLNFLQRKTDVDLPNIFYEAKDRLFDILNGKNHRAKLASSKLFLNGELTELHGYIPEIDNVDSHLVQNYSRILRNKDALQTIAKYTHFSKVEKDKFEQLVHSRNLEQRVFDLGLSADSYRNYKGFDYAVKMAKAFPDQARSHNITNRLGPLSEMNSYDIIRTAAADNMLNSHWMSQMAGNGVEHPLIQAVPELLKKGIITEKESKELKLHAKLSVFRDKGLFKGNFAPDDPIFKDLVKNIRTRQKWSAQEVHNEIVDFTSNTDLRRPSIRTNQNRILNDKQFPLLYDDNPFVTTRVGLGGALEHTNAILTSFSNRISDVLPFRRNEWKHFGVGGNLKFLGGMALTTSIAMTAYNVADFSFASNPVFNDTALEDGITGAAADSIAKGRLAVSRLSDLTGVTGLIKYMDGLMPGSTSTFPGVIAGAAASNLLGGGALQAMKWAAIGGITNRLANPFLPNFGKSYEELRKEYSGESMVPFMKSPTWLLGATPWEGSKVAGYQPNWYVRAKSRWRSTDTLYGSEFRKLIHEPLPLIGFNIGDIVDPYYMERKHYFDRPYPKSGSFGEEIPVIGPLIGATLGRIIKPQITMHQSFLKGEWADESGGGTEFAQRPPNLSEGLDYTRSRSALGLRRTAGQSSMYGTFTYASHKNWAEISAQQTLDNMFAFAGIQGFMVKSLMKRVDEPTVMPTLETAGRMASMTRAYYDMNLGGLGGATEIPRRLLQNQDYKRYGLNPIPNLMPNWLPEEFLTGDPYSSILKGELRLPGCITPDTMVLTDKGMKRADKIDIGDKTLTLKGFKKIEYIIPSYKNEYIYNVDSYTGLPVNVTGNHHVLAVKTNKCKYYKTENINKRPCKPYQTNRKFCKELKCNICDSYAIDWYPVEELSSSDYLVLPKIEINNRIKTIKTKDLIYGSNIEFNNGVFKSFNYLNGKKRYNKTINFPEYLELNKEIMYFFGYYLAEGSISKSRNIRSGITITVSDKELYILNILQDIIYKNFGIKSQIYKYDNRGKCYDLKINSIILATVIDNLLGSVENKHINLNMSNLEYLVAGLYDGDGHISKENIILTASKKYRYSTDILNILLSLNIPYSIRNKNNESYLIKIPLNKINNYLIFKKKEKITNYLSKSSTFIELDKIFLIKIKSITKKFYKGKVFDYQVQDEHNYTTSFLMHNSAYDKTHPNLKRSLPARSSMIGGSPEHMVQYFTGLLPANLREEYDILNEGTFIHKKIQESLAAEGLLLKAEALVYDVKNDISGHVDAIIRDGKGGRGRRALEIKSISSKGFANLSGPKDHHLSQLNFYLNRLRLKHGTLLYINRDNPSEVKTYEINYNQDRFERDVEKLYKARQVAADLMQRGIGDKYGFSYSWLDRLEILADVAPGSNEFKEARELVQMQIKNGMFTQDEITRFETAKKHQKARIRTYELYPKRFLGKVMSPDTELNIQSINENIKSSSEYSTSERVVGAAWEYLLNLNTPVTNKLFAFKDPLEHYKTLKLYGKEYKPWDEPIQSWLEPGVRSMLSKDNPIAGAFSWGIAGDIFGGGLTGAIGASLGAVYGMTHGFLDSITGKKYIPGIIQDQRQIEKYFDQLKYARADRMMQLTNGIVNQEYRNERDSTLYALNSGQSSPSSLFKAAPQMEKPYIASFINVKNPKERAEILKYLPDNLGDALKKTWSDKDNKNQTDRFVRNTSINLSQGSPRFSYDASIMDPAVNFEDIKLKSVEEAGFNSHDFGLGWNEQQLRLQQNKDFIPTINNFDGNDTIVNNSQLNQLHIKKLIEDMFNRQNIFVKVNVYLNETLDKNVVNFTIKRNRSQAVITALNNRKKYMG